MSRRFAWKRAVALGCAVQVLLLGLSAVSPRLHEIAFHFGSDPHPDGGQVEIPVADGDHSSLDELCPVSLFAQGLLAPLSPPTAAHDVDFTGERLRLVAEEALSVRWLIVRCVRAPPVV